MSLIPKRFKIEIVNMHILKMMVDRFCKSIDNLAEAIRNKKVESHTVVK